jgi:hypothetical protein
MISPGSALPPHTGHSMGAEAACCVKAGAEMSGLLSASQKFSLSGYVLLHRGQVFMVDDVCSG